MEPHHLLMREGRDTHLERDPRKASKDVIHVQYLLGDRLGVADQQRTGWSAQSVKLRP